MRHPVDNLVKMKMKQKMDEKKSQDATAKGQTTRVKLQIQMKRHGR
jgi:hypothetical protein